MTFGSMHGVELADGEELGAHVGADGARFSVWAPHAQSLTLELLGPESRRVAMTRDARAVFHCELPSVRAGCDYRYLIDGDKPRPDPRSRHQPAGVHGPSRLVDPKHYAWSDADAAFRCPALSQFVLYEAHVGTFTRAGTFAAMIPHLEHLCELGVTALQLMPVAEFPGTRNWGYDGVQLFAPHSAYGGPDGLKHLVDACHAHGIALVLDVVYNHLGPEGNYLPAFGPYLSSRHRGAWGAALNYDDADSDQVRRFVLDNARYFVREYHIDALRLDAVHGILDLSARHLLEQLNTEVKAEAARSGRVAYVIAESDLNDSRILRPTGAGGYALDAQWSDDLHHALRALLDPRRPGYLADFGRIGELAKALTDGFVYDGCYSSYRRRRHGNASADLPGRQFVVYAQNHDQIANASQGARVCVLVDLEAQLLAATVVACAPNLPLLFMGEEFASPAPFHYFVSHSDRALLDAVRAGRREEHRAFELGFEAADPASDATFLACQLDWSLLAREPHAGVLRFYRALYALRRKHPSLGGCDRTRTRARYDEAKAWLVLERGDAHGEVALCVFNFAREVRAIPITGPQGSYRRGIATTDPCYRGAGECAVPAHAEDFELSERHHPLLPCAARSAAIYLARDVKPEPRRGP